MNTRVPDTVQDMKKETVDSLQQLVAALQDSIIYHKEASEKIEGDANVSSTLLAIANERQQICDNIRSFIVLANETPVEDGTFSGSLRKIWTSFRAGLNSGDATVVLIEAERAEDVIVNKFKNILPQIAGNPVQDKLNKYFYQVKNGHDLVLKMRNAHQAS